jgi:predicted phosphodiesterase
MKISLVSDVHLEFGDWYPVNPHNSEILILSGDIMVASHLKNFDKKNDKHINLRDRYINFLENCSKEYKEVIYIMGNHEHYNGAFTQTPVILREECKKFNIHFLDNEFVKIDGITFIGSTLWTDMNNKCPISIHSVQRALNDFVTIKNVVENEEGEKIYMGKFTPSDSVKEHEKSLKFIESVIQENQDGMFIVVGHHAPSPLSIHPKYKDDIHVNGAYASNLSEFIFSYPQIKIWTHGHTHYPFDYMIGTTRVVCNPRGYVNYERSSNEIDPYLPQLIEI